MSDVFHNLPIMRGVWIAVETCMKIKPEDTVLIVTDTGKTEIAETACWLIRFLPLM